MKALKWWYLNGVRHLHSTVELVYCESPMGHKYLALLERWLEYTGSCIAAMWNCTVFGLIIQVMRKESSLSSSMLLLKPRLSIDCQRCCQSNVLIKGVCLARKIKDYGFNKKAHRWELQMMFCWCMSSTSASSKRYSFASKWTTA